MGGKKKINLFLILLSILILIFLSFVLINYRIVSFSKKYIYSEIEQVPAKYTSIVPGAAVYGNRSVSYVLRDRIEGAMALIEEGKCRRFLVSGDHGTKEYDEVNAARKYVLKMHNVDESIIFMDHAGFSTYETMYRARDVFCVSDCCIVTQKFHIYRAVYIARKLGLDAVGFIAPEINRFSEKTRMSWEIRESFARVKAFFNVAFHTKPTYLGDKIPVTGDGHETWK
ncbi:MAG: YdcF family protein [Treponema sp.]|nr:YdcF family protein [Treponema sp.]